MLCLIVAAATPVSTLFSIHWLTIAEDSTGSMVNHLDWNRHSDLQHAGDGDSRASLGSEFSSATLHPVRDCQRWH